MMVDRVAMCCFGLNIYSVVECPGVCNRQKKKRDRRRKSTCPAAMHVCAEQSVW